MGRVREKKKKKSNDGQGNSILRYSTVIRESWSSGRPVQVKAEVEDNDAYNSKARRGGKKMEEKVPCSRRVL